MRRVIDGKVYDSQRAEQLAEASGGGASVRDFSHWDETLYRTQRGAYFIHGSGGPLTHWARHRGNETSGGEGMRTLTEAQAREWVEKWANDRYESIFGATEEA
ncbi:MAG: hypothetical protein AB1714_11205 [Acidobacteriota bacterium]